MIETKLVRRFGNSGHIVLPKTYVGKRIKLIAQPKTLRDIKYEILDILKTYLENIVGIYLYGSYARNEQTIDSDVDILVITNTKFKVVDRINSYHIIYTTLNSLEDLLKHNAVLILPIIKEAKTIINPCLLEEYKKHKFTRANTKQFIDSTKKILELNKKGLQLDFEVGSLIYSLILRIRGLLMIEFMFKNKLYSKSLLFYYLENNGMSKEKIEEFYRIYTSERENIKVKESNIITKADIIKLLTVAENLMKEVKEALK